jgi:glyoxylase-like metal-dependent hydrolase (beta-lactamase superfamily II)
VKQLADGVWVLPGFPPNAINAWVIEDVLLDAKTRWDARFILRALRGRTITAHAITHAHPDHQGSSHAVCEALGIPFWVPEHDADAAENPRLIRERQPNHPIAQFMDRAFTGPGHRVDRQLHDGDEVAGFRVIDAPGHSAGHVVYFRESDRTLIVGDVLNSADPLTMLPGLRLPKDFFTPDPAQNRVSARKLAELEPALVLFGHGPPVRDTRKFVDFCAAL